MDSIRSDFQRMFNRSMIYVYLCAIAAFILFALPVTFTFRISLIVLASAVGGYFFRDSIIAHMWLRRMEENNEYPVKMMVEEVNE
jgi:UPF0716 family protein affecting phage T7 exclusion